MAENKRYYWLKLKNDFFEDDTIKFIEEKENGIKYSNFYLKLCLKSLKTEGKLIRVIGETILPYDLKSLAKLTGVDVDTVKSAMELFISIGLIKVLESGELYLSQITEMIGSETAVAERVRRSRAKQNLLNDEKSKELLQCNTNVTKCNTEIEKEKDIEKDIDIDIDQLISNLTEVKK